MKVVYTPVVGHIRLFLDDESEYGDRYDCIITVQYLDSDSVFLSGLNGRLTRAMGMKVFKSLKDMGIKKGSYIRNGKTITVTEHEGKWQERKQVLR